MLLHTVNDEVVPISMEDAAYCAAAWASGETQKTIAGYFGYKGGAPVCVAIKYFLQVYADPDACMDGDRRPLVAAALQRFVAQRALETISK